MALIYFKGGNCYADPEIKESFLKWQNFFELFIQSVDARYGNLLHLPFSGGVFEQPCKTMKVFEELRHLYQEHLKEEFDKNTKGIGRKPSGISLRH